MSESKSRSNFKRPSAMWLSIAGVVALAVIASVLTGIALTRPIPQIDASAPLYTIPPEPTATPSSVLTVTRTGEPLKVLFVGGVLTNSVSASADSKGFRATMVRELRKTGEVTSTKTVYTGGTKASTAKVAHLAENQDIVVVTLNPEDVGTSNIDTFTSSYQSLLATIEAVSPGINVICAGVWQTPSIGEKYDAMIAKECASQGGVFRALSDLRAVAANHGPTGRNGVVGGVSDDDLPNDIGYAAIAARILTGIEVS